MHSSESTEVPIGIPRIVRSGLVSVVAATVIGGAVLPASAAVEGPTSGPDRQFGQMVDYPLTFPVPYVTWYRDWYWAARPSGIHHGQDLFAAKGAPVLAAADGTIIRANSSSVSAIEEPDGCCSLVIEHDDGWSTVYAHLDNDTPGTDDGRGWGLAPGIDIGVQVAAGQVVGYVGDSESAEETSSHLHFELRDPDGVIVNPYDTLRAAQGRMVCHVAETGPLGDLIGSEGLLGFGVRGTAVTQLQRLALASRHPPGPIDGVFGSRTESATKALQADLRISADGVVGDETRRTVAALAQVLEHGSALLPEARLMRWGDVGEDIADIQALLSMAGHDPGEADGVFGSQTRSAVESLQDEFAITPDGVIGGNTRAVLGRRLGFTPFLECSG
jgi:peptidoglycan hydrolase-like protein with peptidoglycan-binding domain